MEIRKGHYAKYLHDIAIDQIAEDYINKGFTVNKEVSLGTYQADLVATKENQNIVVEVKTGKLTPDRKKKLAELADYVNTLSNYQFKVAIAKLPKDKELKIDNLEHTLFEYFSNNPPDELTKLATYATPDKVTDIFLNKLFVANNAVIVEGSGIISVQLKFGAGQSADDSFTTHENIPFDFDVQLSFNGKDKLKVDEFTALEIDTSSLDAA